MPAPLAPSRLALAAALLLAAALHRSASAQDAPAASDETRPIIQIALLLDTSSSMQGLLEQAKSRLWGVVNEFVTAKRDGLRPEFWVALYQYGNMTLPAASGYVQRVLPLTDDLDRVSEELFKLRIPTSGNDEFCGRAIQAAVDELTWSPSNDDLKTIFIAGNESFSQGDRDPIAACADAIAKGVTVNTIFCGSEAQGIELGWQNGARRADGAYASINQNEVARRTVAAPQDEELARLGLALNDTYIPFGTAGQTGSQRQEAQDRNAATDAQRGAARAVSKASAFYRNTAWDLVDAVREGKVKLEELEPSELPPALRDLDAEKRRAYLDDKAAARAKIQSRIQELDEARKQFIETRSRAAQTEAASAAQTLDSAVIRTLRDQALKKGFTLERRPAVVREQRF